MKRFLTLAILITGVVSLFTGCSNFLGGSNLKGEIEDKIEYAGFPECKLTITTDYGNIPNSGEYTKRNTDDVTLSYSENDSGYQFVKWICTPVTAGYFDDASLISTKFTINRDNTAAEIVVQPLLYKRPVIESVYPDKPEETYTKDSSIVLKFSEELSDECDLSQILIKMGNQSIEDCFEKPVIKGKTVTIPVNRKNLPQVEVGTVREISVTVPKSMFYKKDGNKILMNEDYCFSYFITARTDATAPSVTYLNVAKTHSDVEQRVNLFEQGSFEDLINKYGEKSVVNEQRECSSVSIGFEANDTGSGLSCIQVTEKLIYSAAINSSTNETNENIFYINEYLDDNNVASGIIDYSLSTDFSSDGIVELEIVFADNSGNKTTPFTFFCIKSNSYIIDASQIVFGKKIFDYGLSSLLDVSTFAGIEESDKYLCFSIDSVIKLLYVFNNNEKYWENPNSYKVTSIELLDSNKNIIETKTEAYETKIWENPSRPDDISYIYKFDEIEHIDKTKGCIFRIYVTTPAGRTVSYEKNVYGAPQITDIIKVTDKPYYRLRFNNSMDFSQNEIYIYYDGDAENNCYCKDDGPLYNNEWDYLIPDTATCVYSAGNYDKDTFFSETIITDNPFIRTEVETSEILNYSFDAQPDKLHNAEKYSVSIGVKDFENYDSVIASFVINDETSVERINSENQVFTFGINNADEINNVKEFDLTITGWKNSVAYQSETKKFNVSSFGNVQAPYIGNITQKYSCCTFKVSDTSESTIDNLVDDDGYINFKVYNLGTTTAFDEVSIQSYDYKEVKVKPYKESMNYYVDIPLVYFYEIFQKYDSTNVVIYLEDINDNYVYSNICNIINSFTRSDSFAVYDTNNHISYFKILGYAGFNYQWLESEDTWSDFIKFDLGDKNAILSDKKENTFYKFTYKDSNHCFRPYYYPANKASIDLYEFKVTPEAGNCEKIRVCADNLVFIHRLYGPYNFGNDIDLWEYWTPQAQKQYEFTKALPYEESRVVKIDGINTTVYYDCYAETRNIENTSIPSGNYYCYIAYFSDGKTSIISDVFYKE